MKKKLIYSWVILVMMTINACEEKSPVDIIPWTLEGIWLTDPALSDDFNAFKYLVFEGSIIHFYGENEIGNREYSMHEFTLLSNATVTGMEVFVKEANSEDDWSFHLVYKFSSDGNTLMVEGLAMTFVGTKVSSLPESDTWVSDVVPIGPEFIINPSISDFYVSDIAKNDVPSELWALGSDGTNSYMIRLNNSTGEILDEINLGSTENYASLTYGGNCENLLGKDEKAVDIVDCTTANLIETINLPDLYRIWSICADESNLWLACDQISTGSKKNIVKVDFNGNKIEESVSFAKVPQSMAYGGGFLWLYRGAYVHKVNPVDMKTITSYRLLSDANFWGYGIEYLAGDILVIDNLNSLYRFTPE